MPRKIGASRKVGRPRGPSPEKSLKDPSVVMKSHFVTAYEAMLKELANKTPKAQLEQEPQRPAQSMTSSRCFAFSLSPSATIHLEPFPHAQRSMTCHYHRSTPDEPPSAPPFLRHYYDAVFVRQPKGLGWVVAPRRDLPRHAFDRPVELYGFYPGSIFRGVQGSSHRPHQVNIEITDTSALEREGLFYGFLTIQELTKELPTLTTFFKAEILNPVNATRRIKGHPRTSVALQGRSWKTKKWDATDEVDFHYWSGLAGFRECCDFPTGASTEALDRTKLDQYFRAFFASEFQDLDHVPIPGLRVSRYIFMRWKELFLCPNHKVSSIPGASFDGFYYMCYDRETHTIKGTYYHLVRSTISVDQHSLPQASTIRPSIASTDLLEKRAWGDSIELKWDPRNEARTKGLFNFS